MSHIAEGVGVLVDVAYAGVKILVFWLTVFAVLALGSCATAGFFAYKYFTS